MTITAHITTAEQLLRAGDIGRCELVKGKLIMMSPAGSAHGRITNEMAFRLTQHVKARRLGTVYAAETGFKLSRHPDTVRAPDVAFVHVERAKALESQGFFEGAPDLAVEVLSPEDSAKEMQNKVQDFLSAGAKVVWVVDPRKATIAVHIAGAPVRVLRDSDRLEGGDVVPGFELVVGELFEV